MTASRRIVFAFASAIGGLAAVSSGCASMDTPLGPLIRPQSQPTISGLAPARVAWGAPATVTVTGTGFLPDPSIFVGTIPTTSPDFITNQIHSVQFVDTTRLVVTVPPTLPAGDLDFTLVNPDAGALRLRGALSVVKPGSNPPQPPIGNPFP